MDWPDLTHPPPYPFFWGKHVQQKKHLKNTKKTQNVQQKKKSELGLNPCVELGRTDDHFSTAARVKKTVIPPTDSAVGSSQLARSGDHSRAKPAKTWLSVCQSLAMSSG